MTPCFGWLLKSALNPVPKKLKVEPTLKNEANEAIEMTEKQYNDLYRYMKRYSEATVHDEGHILRVLSLALIICESEKTADTDVVIAAALLHDVGRGAQNRTGQPHAAIGADMAYTHLLKRGWQQETAKRVRHCVEAHSSGGTPPQTLEAKIVHDADTLDLNGYSGVVRALQYAERLQEKLYLLDADGSPLFSGQEISAEATTPKKTTFDAYRAKIQNMASRLYTPKGKAIATQRQREADSFFSGLQKEIAQTHDDGLALLKQHIK